MNYLFNFLDFNLNEKKDPKVGTGKNAEKKESNS